MKQNCQNFLAAEKWILLILLCLKNVYFWQPNVDMVIQHLIQHPNPFNRPWHWMPHICKCVESKIAKKYFNHCIVCLSAALVFCGRRIPPILHISLFVQCQVFPAVSRCWIEWELNRGYVSCGYVTGYRNNGHELLPWSPTALRWPTRRVHFRIDGWGTLIVGGSVWHQGKQKCPGMLAPDNNVCVSGPI